MVEKMQNKEYIKKLAAAKPLIVTDDQGNHLYHCRTCYTSYLTEREALSCCATYDEMFWDELRVLW
jgi:hypothetical protein